MLTFQGVLAELAEFWTARGALTVQPFNTEVGAGTANPATTLRVLGPEPWRAAYVEPSVRPDDSRYGENPNRLQTHTQFQVILKPDPGNPQETYLDSLDAIGIDLRAHDVRFVEDNWASPALGAWGLGWEVWLDGMEITQFTYFQQAGSLQLDPVSVEITYGLERIVMALQGVQHFKDILYAPGLTYGEIFGQIEYEMSRYYLEDADIETTRQLYALHAAEAQALIDRRLPVPAYYNILKCSHTFNVLDARGAISTAERARAFNSMRRLSKAVAELWVSRRAELNFPLGQIEAPPRAQPLPSPPAPAAPATLLFEIGVEELPATEVPRAQGWLAEELERRLRGTRLDAGAVRTYATPRRLVAVVSDVAPAESNAVSTVRGPRASVAFDAQGAATKAGAGFAAKHGLDPDDLGRITDNGVEYVAVERRLDGRSAPEVLSEVLQDVVTALRADRNMRWSDPELSYVRAIRWLLAVLGETPIPVTASRLTSGTTTRVQRLGDPSTVTVPAADGYLDLLRRHDVIADRTERRQVIDAAATELAASVGGRIDDRLDGGVVEEIVDLVEKPVPVLGQFDTRYLDLPGEILLAVMRKHQRYIPIREQSGDALLPYFVTFANGACDVPTVAAGNGAVVRARFEDALFFWNADRAKSLDELKEALAKLAFEATLGSMLGRSARIARNAVAIADQLSLDGAVRATVERAAELAKFDLASQMVIEMTSLAGTMAAHLARAAGETAEVAQALEGMERPRTSDDEVAPTLAGAVLAVADRADLLAGLFAVGVRPTGSSDPFALRRAALGLLATLRSRPELDALGVRRLLQAAAATIAATGVAVADDVVAETAEFVDRRFEQLLLDEGHDSDLISAVLPLADRPGEAGRVLAEIRQLADRPTFLAFVEVVQRVRRLIGDSDGGAGEWDGSADEGVRDLLAALAARTTEPAPTLGALMSASEAVVQATSNFLNNYQVFDPDPRIREARVRALREVVPSWPVLDWEALARYVK